MPIMKSKHPEAKENLLAFNKAAGLLVLLLLIGTTGLLADPVLTRPETVADRIIIYPDHKNPKLLASPISFSINMFMLKTREQTIPDPPPAEF